MGIRKTPHSDADFLPGTLEMLILKTLSRGQNHGFGIAQHIQQVSKDALRIGEGSLYPALRTLESEGLVVSRWEPQPSGPARKVYELTEAGRAEIVARTRSWREFVEAVENVIGGTPHVSQPI